VFFIYLRILVSNTIFVSDELKPEVNSGTPGMIPLHT